MGAVELEERTDCGPMTAASELVAEIIRLNGEGRGDDAIGRQLGCTRHRVRKVLAEKARRSPSSAEVMGIQLELCYPSPQAREINLDAVKSLADSIERSGLMHPITVRRKRMSRAGRMCDAFEVIAGMHRVKAFRRMGRTEIPAMVIEMDDLRAELMLIDENLCRQDLSPAERAIAIKRRKWIYMQLHPETAHGSTVGKERAEDGSFQSRKLCDSGEAPAERFTEMTARLAGVAERTIQLDVARAEKIGDAALKRIVGTSLDKGEELDALAKLSNKKREELIERAVAGVAVTAKTAAKQANRAKREVELAEKIAAGNLALPDERYGVILADWPRKPRAWSEETGFDRAPGNHYATQSFRWAIDVLAPMIQKLAAPDAMLVMWTTAASLIDDIEIMTEAGFCALRPRGSDGRLLRDGDREPLAAVSPGGGTYRSHQVWDKQLRGMGRWFIDQHELVLVGVRGKVPCPAPGQQSLSIFSEKRGEPSVKPDFVAAEIDRLWPHLPKIELFRRGPARPGWTAWGLEAEPANPSPVDGGAFDDLPEPEMEVAPKSVINIAASSRAALGDRP